MAHGERDATGKKRGKGEHAITEPLPTQPCSNEFALVAPTLIQVGYGERDGQAPRILDLHQPLGTIVGQGMKHALVAAVIAKHNGGWDNRSGYKPDEPLHTIIAHGGQQAVVAAFLAKHNGGHEATGQMFTQPADTITCRENKALVTAHIQRDFGNSIGAQADAPAPTITAGGGGKSALVTSHLVKFKGTCRDGQPVDEPIHTVQAHGNHYAEVRVEAHALKDARIPAERLQGLRVPDEVLRARRKTASSLRGPLDTVTTKDRFALVTVTVDGETYVIVDIGMRMLTPRELFRCQGFPARLPDPVSDAREGQRQVADALADEEGADAAGRQLGAAARRRRARPREPA
jgi:DNA (cytosine-5)-methyltransferase 1